MNQAEYLLAERAKASALGDRGVYQAITADLRRIGYVEPAAEAAPEPPPPAPAPERVETDTGRETTTVQAPERAVPQAPTPARKPATERRGRAKSAKKNRGGRPPLPRCQHGRIVGRCGKCKTAG